MRTEEILIAMRRLKVETGSLACMGCGREHDCGIHGCRIVREAAELIEKLADRCALRRGDRGAAGAGEVGAAGEGAGGGGGC